MRDTWIALVACALSVLICGLAWFRHNFVMVSVSGRSMQPAFQSGDRMIVRRQPVEGIEVGAVVVFRHPLAYDGWGSLPMARSVGNGRWAVKRVAALPGDAVPDSVRLVLGGPRLVPVGKMVVLADDDRGYDSRQWGFIPMEHILGSVARRL